MGYRKKDPSRISNTNANRNPIETSAGAAACEAAVKTT